MPLKANIIICVFTCWLSSEAFVRAERWAELCCKYLLFNVHFCGTVPWQLRAFKTVYVRAIWIFLGSMYSWSKEWDENLYLPEVQERSLGPFENLKQIVSQRGTKLDRGSKIRHLLPWWWTFNSQTLHLEKNLVLNVSNVLVIVRLVPIVRESMEEP